MYLVIDLLLYLGIGTYAQNTTYKPYIQLHKL